MTTKESGSHSFECPEIVHGKWTMCKRSTLDGTQKSPTLKSRAFPDLRTEL
jgi:hypothetical protein